MRDLVDEYYATGGEPNMGSDCECYRCDCKTDAAQKYQGPKILELAEREQLDVYALLHNTDGMIVCGTKASLRNLEAAMARKDEMAGMIEELIDLMERSDMEQFDESQCVSDAEWFGAINRAKAIIAC